MSVYTKRLSVVFLFIINIVTGQDVCPPNNFSAEEVFAEVNLNWENLQYKVKKLLVLN